MTRATVSFDPGLPRWLQAQKIALVLSTYRANRLLFIGTNEQAELKFQERLYDRPMGLFAAGNSLWMAVYPKRSWPRTTCDTSSAASSIVAARW